MMGVWTTAAAIAVLAYTGLALQREPTTRFTQIVLGTYLLFFMALAPLLHFLTGYVLAYPDVRADIPSLFLPLAAMNAMGMAFAFLGHAIIPKIALSPLQPIPGRLFNAAAIMIGISVLAWLAANLMGAIRYDESMHYRVSNAPIIVYMLFESMPFWLAVAYALASRNRKVGIGEVIAVSALLVAVAAVFTGLRGSRSSVGYQVFAALCIIHAMVRPFRLRELVAATAIGAVGFIAYGLFKFGGWDGLLLRDGKVAAYAMRMSNPLRILLFDFGRSDVQALILNNTIKGYFTPPPLPETYMHAFTQILPQSMRPDWIRAKSELGPIAMYNLPWSQPPEGLGASRMYGLGGEALLNFGVWGVAPAFFVFGVLHRLCTSIQSQLGGTARVLLPLVIIVPYLLQFFDLAQIVFFLIKNWMIPLLVIGVSMVGFRRRRTA